MTNGKNLTIHSVIGIILLMFLIFAPLDPSIRMAILLGVVAFNVFRMKYLD
ncbi:hypothetical protein [Methanobacterium sp. ACI-7]|uniref:hypothetical protein n=1 Tax=Methanobacterium sp. ACI-7 TaxID=3240853 RepID=UPI0039C21E83